MCALKKLNGNENGEVIHGERLVVCYHNKYNKELNEVEIMIVVRGRDDTLNYIE